MVFFRVVPPKLCERTKFSHTVLKIMIFCSVIKQAPKEENHKSNEEKGTYFTQQQQFVRLYYGVV